MLLYYADFPGLIKCTVSEVHTASVMEWLIEADEKTEKQITVSVRQNKWK